MSNFPGLPQKEQFFPTGFSASGFMALLRPAQKNMVWMRDIISKLTVPVELIQDCCAGTFSVARAFMRLPQHRQYVGSDLDEKSVASSFSQLILIFTCQIFNKESDITG